MIGSTIRIVVIGCIFVGVVQSVMLVRWILIRIMSKRLLVMNIRPKIL